LSWEPIGSHQPKRGITARSCRPTFDALVLENAWLAEGSATGQREGAPQRRPDGESRFPRFWRRGAVPPADGRARPPRHDGSRLRGLRPELFLERMGSISSSGPQRSGLGRPSRRSIKAFYEGAFRSRTTTIHESPASLAGLQVPEAASYAKLLGPNSFGQRPTYSEVGCGTVAALELSRHHLPHGVHAAPIFAWNSLRARRGVFGSSTRSCRACAFLRMNLVPSCAPSHEQYDVVSSATECWHHTSDPYGGFRSIARLLRPGPLLVIGSLYNRHGRAWRWRPRRHASFS
jgi:hypothetical protein